MRALVTGASGFLGGRVAQMLAGRGAEVVVLARAESDLRHLDGFLERPSPVRVVRGGLGDAAALEEAMRGVTQVFHCAACSTDWAARETYVAANVTGTRNLLASARAAGTVERFLHVSTTDVYGYPERPGGEDEPIRDAGKAWLPYNATKVAGERAVWEAHAAGLPVTVVRPATIYGPRGKDFTQEIGTMLRQRLMAVVAGGRAAGGFTYVDNVAEAMFAAAASAKTLGEAYNISDGTNATWREYCALFARELGTPEPWIDLPFGLAMGMARGLEAVHRTLRLPGRPLLTRHAVLLLGRDQEFPAEKARRGFWVCGGGGVGGGDSEIGGLAAGCGGA